MHIIVADTGSGSAAEHLPHLFERFYRADPSRGRESGNAGLGLSIAQGLMHAMGGRLVLESQLGQGTTVFVTLPIAAFENNTSPEATITKGTTKQHTEHPVDSSVSSRGG